MQYIDLIYKILPPLADILDAFHLIYGTIIDTVRRLCKLQCSDAFFLIAHAWSRAP